MWFTNSLSKSFGIGLATFILGYLLCNQFLSPLLYLNESILKN